SPTVARERRVRAREGAGRAEWRRRAPPPATRAATGATCYRSRAHESARTLLRLGGARRRGHGRRLRTGIDLLARRVSQAARRIDALEPERHLDDCADQLVRHGCRLVLLGRAVGPPR